MPLQIDLVVFISLALTCLSTSFAIFFGAKARQKDISLDDKLDAENMAIMINELKHLNSNFIEFKTTFTLKVESIEKNTRESEKEINKKLTLVEASAKSAHKRIDNLV